jgi:hypothetical protein
MRGNHAAPEGIILFYGRITWQDALSKVQPEIAMFTVIWIVNGMRNSNPYFLFFFFFKKKALVRYSPFEIKTITFQG